ncbi:MAG: presenilin family intramembrane aspartyl protease PSH [Candidatus Thermoplasmatota archaeon]|nr:presenilin family intramembrane aspartyl protease PSH [Candidatus Thermoplasmatota archaeon]
MEGDSIHPTAQIKEMLGAMKEQWQSMLGMAIMFVVTIIIGIVIQPFYDKPEFRAFGEAGASQARNILLEFVMILVFTAAIIFLAKKKKDWIIKYGILGILFIALCYSTIPLTNLMISTPSEPLEFEINNNPYEIISQKDDGFFASQKLVNKTTGEFGGYAFYSFSNAYDETGLGPLNMLHQGVVFFTNEENYTFSMFNEGMVICDGSSWLKLDQSYDVSEDMNNDIDCSFGFTANNIDWYISSNNTLHKVGGNQSYDIPEFINNESTINIWSTENNQLIWVTEDRFALLNLPTNGGNFTIEFEKLYSTKITTATLGSSLWQETEIEQKLLVLGDNEGNVTAWNVDLETNYVPNKETRMNLDNGLFNGPIKSVLLANYNNFAQDELFVIDSENFRMFRSSNLVEQINMTIEIENGGILALSNTSSNSINSVVFIQMNDKWQYLTIDENQFVLVNEWAVLIGLCVSIFLMVVLFIRPEWYVVNSVGILVGAGVIAMLGISFVPWLIIIFMVVAAIYDAWAVYKSKHMLDLADTMVNLKLPILLVAPQEKNYSFLDEKDTMRDREISEEDWEIKTKSFKNKKEKSSKDAMFMGLGDVIFPGILVISAITWLPQGTIILGLDATIWIGLITMVGGLCGYFILMGYVALGRPQAGLPLLNSGAILGYFISTLILLGISALEFNISF